MEGRLAGAGRRYCKRWGHPRLRDHLCLIAGWHVHGGIRRGEGQQTCGSGHLGLRLWWVRAGHGKPDAGAVGLLEEK